MLKRVADQHPLLVKVLLLGVLALDIFVFRAQYYLLTLVFFFIFFAAMQAFSVKSMFPGLAFFSCVFISALLFALELEKLSEAFAIWGLVFLVSATIIKVLEEKADNA